MDSINKKLTRKNINYCSDDYFKVKSLYEEAFPKIERYEYDSLFSLCETGKAELYAYFDSAVFVGFSFDFFDEDYDYLFYFATKSELRNKGYGSQMLRMIVDAAGDKTVVLDIEPADERADNFEQRKHRASFYERRGFTASDYEMVDETGHFRVYSNNAAKFTAEKFKKLWTIFPEAFDGTELVLVK